MTDVWGFGSPSSPGAGPGADPYFDWGFGDPLPGGWTGVPEDLGFGDVPPAAVVVVLVPIEADQRYPDDGGEVVHLKAAWVNVMPIGTGPFRVQLVDAFTGQVYPPMTDTLGAYSGIPEQGPDCLLDEDKTELTFVLPVAPPGLYDLVVTWGPIWGAPNEITVPKALRLIYRNRAASEYRMRRLLPELFGAGPRASGLETHLEG